MTSFELRQRFLDFYKKRGHTVVPSSSLLPTDPSVLFTTAGMQQFKPYYLGEKSPYGQNVASYQKCFRTSDIEEVGDESHLTFLEMLGNFSFGGYFKEEAIKLAYDFLFIELKLSIEKTIFTVFEGNAEVPEDKESAEIWKKLGVPASQIKKCGREDNFWGPTGEEGPCGPTTEIHFNGTEIWNLVFNEYFQDKDKKLTPLAQKGVDTGMGLERLAMSVQGKSNVFETDLFLPIIDELRSRFGVSDEKTLRIISDHIKGSVFLIAEGILPSNVERGYILRRILRRAIRYGKMQNIPEGFLISLAQKAIGIYYEVYPDLKSKESEILDVIKKEEEKFEKTLKEGLKEFERMSRNGIDAEGIFKLYSSYGFPPELTEELANEKGLSVDLLGFKEQLQKHQEISRAGAQKKFGGHGADGYHSEEALLKVTKLHTATHLLHSSLRKILGDHVQQMGSDINADRLRFDFSHPAKVEGSQLKEIEDLVNEKIKESLDVGKEEMEYDKAIASGALAFFKEKYPEKVNVYSAGDFSREICAGPHVQNTAEMGHFKITKEESAGAGIRRIRGILE